MKRHYMTVGEFRKEMADFSDDWLISFTFEGNHVHLNMLTVRGRKEVSGENLLQIDFSPLKDGK